MYLSIGPGAAVPQGEIVGVFDLDCVSWSHRTRESLKIWEAEGRVRNAGEDLPRTVVITAAARRRGCAAHSGHGARAGAAAVYLTSLSGATLVKRLQSGRI